MTERSIIADYFDQRYYLSVYPDVAAAKADPVDHFLNHGWREGRNPNSWFITRFYLMQNPDIRHAGVNPFVHYVQHGRREGRLPAPQRLDRPATFAHLLAARTKAPRRSAHDASIVLPVYNAFDDVTAVLENLERTVDSAIGVVVVDDCSPDARIGPLLTGFAGRNGHWTVLRNERNLGFAASVNRGIGHCAGHVVIVNSDTLLPRNWLDLLLAPIWQDEESVASVTPFSNNSSLTGFPSLRQEAELGPGESVEDIADAFARLPSLAIDIVSGIGFCMAMNRRALDAIGLFDTETYRNGYFEDTDWCQRAVLAGFRNVAPANLFVHHKLGSSSYGLELRKHYSQRNREAFEEKYPFYGDCEQAYLSNDPLFEARTLARAIMWRGRARAGVLIVDHAWGGGANMFSAGLRRRLLAEGAFVVTVTIIQSIVELTFSFQSEELSSREDFSTDIWKLTDLFAIDEIAVNGVHGAHRVPDVLAALVGLSEKSKLVFYVHDYMSVCPSIFLLDGNDAYCGVPDIQACYSCLFSNAHARFQAVNQTEWRRAWGAFLAHAHEIRVFSASSRDILEKAYPALAAPPRITVVEPEREADLASSVTAPGSGEGKARASGRRPPARLRVGIMGSLDVHKGSRLVADLARHIQAKRLPISLALFGSWHDGPMPKAIEDCGPYGVTEIADRVSDRNISVMLFPSVCPETYSYTLSEIFGMELPVVALGLGAQAERLGRYEWGVLVEESSPAAICDALYKAEALRRTQPGSLGRSQDEDSVKASLAVTK